MPSTPLSKNAVPRRLRLPLLALVGALSMGSGWGNPGCGSSDGPDKCTGRCANIEGTYQLTFEDTRPLGPQCEALGLSLPNELVISRREEILFSQLQGVELSGTYYESTRNLDLLGDGTMSLANGETVPIRLIVRGFFDAHPQNTTEQASFRGSYMFFRLDELSYERTCDIERALTAGR